MKQMINLFKGLRKNKLKRSMLINTLCKPLGMAISFLYTPLLLGYLGQEAYGVWSTILSVINWINYFDVGIGQGLRNMLAKSISEDAEADSRIYVSTGYTALSFISLCTLVAGLIAINVVNVNKIFNTNISTVKTVLTISFICICINFVLGLSRTLLYSTQQAEKVGILTLTVQLINFAGIFLLSQFSKGNLIFVSIVIGMSGIIANLIFTFNVFNKNQYLIPKFSMFETKHLKSICSLGVKFFIIQISALILYTTDNMIITQLFGPSRVTPYNTTYTAFGILNTLFNAMIAPLWSRYTVAMNNGEYNWIKKSIIKLDMILPIIAILLAFEVAFFKPLSLIWLHRTLDYDKGLTIFMAIYYFLYIWSSIYANFLNGVNAVNLELFLGVFTAILNIPLSIFLGKNCGMGATGVCAATCICMLISTLGATIQSHYILNKEVNNLRN